jgi:hypothetical protein
LNEAEACGDLESQAEFLFQGAQLNIMEGKSQENTISLIEVTRMFDGLTEIIVDNEINQMIVLCIEKWEHL